MCDCIQQLRKQVKDIDPQSDIEETQTYMDKNAKVGSTLAFTERMCAHFSVRNKKKDGSFSTKGQRNVLSYTYCPFCGEKYVK